MTQLESAKRGIITEEMKRVAEAERVDAQTIRGRMAEGRLVIPCNKNRKAEEVCGIGEGLRTKVNANIGTSVDFADLQVELEKLRMAEEAKADAVMDLSTGGDLAGIRRAILGRSMIPVGTVPIYETACKLAQNGKSMMEMTKDFLSCFELNPKQGIW